MVKEIEADYSQQFLLPPSLDDWVLSDHPVRFIRFFAESLDLRGLGFKERESKEGRPNYSNDLLLKIWLYGFFEKVTTSRQLERACRNFLPLIWLTGMKYPDHNTIWRFFDKNRLSIKEVFKQTVQLAVKNDMVGFALQAVDGTKIMADVSKRRSFHRKDIKKFLSKLDESLEETLSEIEEREKSESGQPGYHLPKHLQDKVKLRSVIEKGLSNLSQSDKRGLRDHLQSGIEDLDNQGVDHLSITDKESRLMKNDGGLKFSYNAQSVVDDKKQIVVGSKVSQSSTDNLHLTEMIDEAEDNTGKRSEETVADSGYFSGEELSAAEDKDCQVLVNRSSSVGSRAGDEENAFSKDKFEYDGEKDQYLCPLGKILLYKGTVKREKLRYEVKVYKCKNFRDCPYRDICSKGSHGRSIERSPYDDAIERQLLKQNDPVKKELLGRRGLIVEPLYGWIKHNLGIRRWSYRGLESVGAQWNLICTTINLKKLYKKWQENGLTFS